MNASAQPTRQSTDSTSTRSHGINRAFVVVAAIAITFLAASAAPTPLYSRYQIELSLSPVTVTVIFAAYAAALLISLLITGRLSDFVGRKPVIITAIGVQMVAMIVFVFADSAGDLICARVLQGLATGTATAVTGAALSDLRPERAPVIASVSPVVGMALGALGASILVAYAPGPEMLVYIVFLALFVVLAWAASALLPETAPRRHGAMRSLRPQVSVPPAARTPLLVAAPILIAVWSLGGFYLSLGPSLAREISGIESPVIGGLLVSALTFSGAGSILALRSQPPVKVFKIGALALMVGLATTLVGILANSLSPLFLGTVIAGVGFGAGFQGAMRTVMPAALPEARAGLLSTFYIVSYLSMGLPAIAAGLLTTQWVIESTALALGSVVIALSGIALCTVAVTRRRSAGATESLPTAHDVRRHANRTGLNVPAEREQAIAATARYIFSVTDSLRSVELSETPPAHAFSIERP